MHKFEFLYSPFVLQTLSSMSNSQNLFIYNFTNRYFGMFQKQKKYENTWKIFQW